MSVEAIRNLVVLGIALQRNIRSGERGSWVSGTTKMPLPGPLWLWPFGLGANNIADVSFLRYRLIRRRSLLRIPLSSCPDFHVSRFSLDLPRLRRPLAQLRRRRARQPAPQRQRPDSQPAGTRRRGLQLAPAAICKRFSSSTITTTETNRIPVALFPFPYPHSCCHAPTPTPLPSLPLPAGFSRSAADYQQGFRPSPDAFFWACQCRGYGGEWR